MQNLSAFLMTSTLKITLACTLAVKILKQYSPSSLCHQELFEIFLIHLRVHDELQTFTVNHVHSRAFKFIRFGTRNVA